MKVSETRKLFGVPLALTMFLAMSAIFGSVVYTDFIDVNDYVWIEGDSLDIGFSKYGEMIGYNEATQIGLGLQYPGYTGAGDTYDQREDTSVDPFANEYIGVDWWMNGWFIDIKYTPVGGPNREIWAMATFSDGQQHGGDWITMPSLPSNSSARPLWQEYPPYANPDSTAYAGIVDPIPSPGGRKTNGLCTTDPVEIVSNDASNFTARCKTTVSDVDTGINLVALRLTFVFNKAEKSVIILKDVERLYTKRPMNIQFGNRGQWDLGLAGDTDSYIHWYTSEPVQYWDTDGDGTINGTEVETTFEIYKDYFLTNKHPEKWWDEVPESERPTQVFNEFSEVTETFPETWLEAQEGSYGVEGHLDPTIKEDSYAVAQVISQAGDYVGALGVWPHPEFWSAANTFFPPARTVAPDGNNPSSLPLMLAPISRMLEWHKWTVEEDPNQGEVGDLDDRDDIWVIGDDIRWPDGSTLEPIIPFVIYEHDFQLSSTLPEYRVVSAYVLSDYHDADDADADDPGNEEPWSSGQNVIDWEIKEQLGRIFNPTPIYIRPDGSIDPTSAPIMRYGDLYTLTDNVFSDTDCVVIERNNMTLDGAGYTLQGYGSGDGFKLTNIDNVTIKNVTIKGFLRGVHLSASSGNVIHGNVIEDNEWGIQIEASSNNNVYDNTIKAEIYNGIILESSSNNSITGNNITDNGNFGIVLTHSSNNNTLFENNVANNTDGMGLWSSCANNSILNNNVTNMYNGITLSYSSNNTLSENYISDNYYGIWLYYSLYNVLSENNVTNNLEVSVLLTNSQSNRIFHNNFINNVRHVLSQDSSNVWDDGYPSGGNYWSEYVDTDYFCGPNQDLFGGDGVWDRPYLIDANNTDSYPLVEPYVSGNLTVSIYTDKDTYNAGDTMHLGLNITNPDSVKYQCFVIWCTLPDSSVYPVVHQHSVVLPIGMEYSNPSFKTFTIPNLPDGTYTWHVAFLDRTTHTIIVHDTAEWQFS